MTQKSDFVEVKIQKKFLWMVSCPEIFNKGNNISIGEDDTRLYWIIFTKSEYEQFMSNHGFEESKCGECFSIWKENNRLGSAIKS